MFIFLLFFSSNKQLHCQQYEQMNDNCMIAFENMRAHSITHRDTKKETKKIPKMSGKYATNITKKQNLSLHKNAVKC